jgi:hypothetical protein
VAEETGTITGEQMKLLEDFVDAYWTPHENGKDKFHVYTAGGAGTTIGHRSFEPGPNMNEDTERRADPGDIEELASYGLIDLDGHGRKGAFHPTADGKRVVEEHREKLRVVVADAQLSGGGGGSGIDWGSALPVLQAVVDLMPSVSPGDGVSQGQINAHLGRGAEDPDTGVKLEMLVEAGYIASVIAGFDQMAGPLTVKPREKALQLLAGWPADGTVAVERLLAVLDRQIATTADEEEKGKLQAFRDAASNLGQSVAAQVLTKVIMGELG